MGIKLIAEIEVKGEFEIILRHVVTGKEKRLFYRNRVVNGGLGMIAQRLAGEGNTCEITYGAVGTDNTAPSATQTTLGAELARKLLSTRSRDGNAVNFSVYFSTGEANGSLKEFAVFGDGASGTPDSGTMFNRGLINVTKTSSYTMTVLGSFKVQFKEA